MHLTTCDAAPSALTLLSRLPHHQDLDNDARNILECARALQRASGSPAVHEEHMREALEAVGKVKGGGGGAGGDGNLTKEELEETMKKMLAVRVVCA